MSLKAWLSVLCVLLLPLTAVQAVPDWSRTTVATADGGYRVGNPDAKVKLIEYASLTCAHCARFDKDGKTALAALVQTGKVSFEFRNFVLNGADLAASLTARCGGPSTFFPMVRTLFVTQPHWMAKLSALPQAESDKLRLLPVAERLNRIAEVGGLTNVAQLNGTKPANLKVCLADEAALAKLVGMAQAGRALGVRGTPTFFINGKKLNVNDWRGVEAEIRRAGG